ncbi:ion transporter [Turneriella parva]|uniref:Ion transport protein n=1 Tax=Turneriella parva (strain ATCC BAA-1111 / DSM 21527 / NCTC 11395 / H) TaxID=869212 RepID=I4B2E5_TURPD|nr:ion transporter [Turneriella parva]AFM11452.1 Ion transport protein [Turneriella parva DSM 21527]
MPAVLSRIAHARWFQNFITTVIVLASVLVGVETYPQIEKQYHRLLHALDLAIITIFTIEVLVKIGAEGRHPLRYFKDPWNVFDFVIVAACFLPFDNQYITVLRLIRLLRVLRLLRAFPKLQVLVGAIFKSIPSMGYVSLLMGLLFYLYAVAGVLLFGKNDPVHFGNLGSSLLSLFQTVTLEGWIELLNIQLYGCDKFGYEVFKDQCTQPSTHSIAPLFFISFVLVGTFVLLNLFIGVILTGMEEARNELADLKNKESSANPREYDLKRIETEIARLNESLKTLQVTKIKFRAKDEEEA